MAGGWLISCHSEGALATEESNLTTCIRLRFRSFAYAQDDKGMIALSRAPSPKSQATTS